MTRMQIPAHLGTCISVSGFTLDADEDRCVDVPNDLRPALESHGLTVAAVKAEAVEEKKPSKK
jgi:hypothetical protein